MKNLLCYILWCYFAVVHVTYPVEADEILTTIDEAVVQYKNGDFNGSASNLEYASQLIRQKKSEALIKVLPDPFSGWEAEPASSQATGTTVFGRSINVSRLYNKNPSNISIEITTDSPLMQSLVMMLHNPVIAGAGGARLETFSEHKGIVQYNETNRSGEVNIVVDERFIVTVKGQEVQQKELIAYAEAVKYSDLIKN